GLGFIHDWCRGRGTETVEIRAWEGEPFPAPERIERLVVLGGPAAAWEEDAHPWLTDEKRFLESAIAAGVPTLGICLGAQLLADVLGAEVRRHHHPEIGWHAVELTEAGRGTPVEELVGPGRPVMQWHYDTFEIPDGARHLARNDACERQAFAWGEGVLGLQFHPEMVRDEVATVVDRDGPVPEGRYVQSAEEILRPEPFSRMAAATARFMDRLVAEMPPPGRP
ncbi:MAG: type 1 glutamine amidotransferase, partial [Acidobacteriota bacterium]